MKSKLLWCAIGLTIICPMILGYHDSELGHRQSTRRLEDRKYREEPHVWIEHSRSDWWGRTQWWGLLEIDFYAHDGNGRVGSLTFVNVGPFRQRAIYLPAYQVVLIAGAPLAMWSVVLVLSIVRRLRRGGRGMPAPAS